MPAEGGAPPPLPVPEARVVAPRPRVRPWRVGVAVALPILAYALEKALWPQLQPFAWILLYPAVFAASWVGGLAGGLLATAIAAAFAWYGFVAPVGGLIKGEARYGVSVFVFVAMGVGIAAVHERLRRTGRALRDANEALQARQAELRALFDGASVGIAYIRNDGRIADFNERFRSLLGYDREALRGKHFLDITHPDDREADRTGWARAVKEGRARYVVEKRYVRADRSSVWVRADVGILPRARPGALSVVAVVEDISDRKRAEAEVKRLADVRERVAAEAAGVGVWDLDLRTWRLTWSDVAFRMLGYEPTPDGGADPSLLLERIEPPDLPPVLEAIARARDERSLMVTEHRIVRADGTRWARSFGRFLYDEETGEPCRFVGMAFDDTQRHLAEAARREAEAHLGLLVQSVREYALTALDAEGRVASWNAGAERIFGYTAEEALGQSRATFVPPEDAVDAAELLALARREGSAEIEGWRVRKDGTRFWADVVLAARRDEQGAVTGYFTVTRDLTDRRRAEQEIQAANARLRDRVADLEAFSYTVAHDLRAPLRAIQGYARFVDDDLARHGDPGTRRMLAKIRDAALRMDHLIRDVLSYTHIAGGAVEGAPVDLDEIVAHLVSHYPELSAARIHVRSPLGAVRGQASLLVQILSNLLANAVKFVPDGRVPEVEVRSEPRPGGILRVVVADNGIGIAREHWDRIFLPFERLDPRDGRAGTGIGLAIVKRAVEQLGGDVGVESAPGEGSRFWFELPEAPRAA